MSVMSPCSPLELLEQFGGGGGEAVGLTTGAKALFCLTAAEKEKTPWEELQLETAMVGLEGTTKTQRQRPVQPVQPVHPLHNISGCFCLTC